MKRTLCIATFSCVAFSAVWCSTALGQTVRLQDKAVVNGGSVKLGDIATVQNADAVLAEALAQTVIVAKLQGETRVQANDVLFAIVAQRPELAARLQVQGAAQCVVTAGGVEEPKAAIATGTKTAVNAAAQANQPLRTDSQVVTAAVVTAPVAGGGGAVAAETKEPGTLAQLLTAQAIEELQVGPNDVRLTFDTVNPLLDQPIGPNQKWVFRPLGRTFLGTVQWEAQLQQGRQTLQKLTVQASVLKRVQGVVSTAVVKKGDVITAEMVKPEDRWVDRNVPAQFTSASDVIGQEAQRAIAAGSVMDQRDFKPTELVGRDDVVEVFFMSGGLKVKMQARAISGGKLHDHVTVRNETSGERYDGLVIGKRLVLVGPAVDAKTEQKLREEK